MSEGSIPFFSFDRKLLFGYEEGNQQVQVKAFNDKDLYDFNRCVPLEVVRTPATLDVFFFVGRILSADIL